MNSNTRTKLLERLEMWAERAEEDRDKAAEREVWESFEFFKAELLTVQRIIKLIHEDY